MNSSGKLHLVRAVGLATLALWAQGAAAASVLQFADRAVIGTEGETLDITLVRTGDPTGAPSAVINIGIASSASLNIDYTVDLAGGVVSFADGELSTSISVNLEQDSEVEGTEFALISLGAPGGGAQVGERGSVRLEILDAQTVPVTLDLATRAVERVNEGDALTVGVTRSGTATRAQTVELASRGLTAQDGTDFTTLAEQFSFDTGGPDEQTTTLFTQDNGLADGNRLLELQLSDPLPAGVSGIGLLNTLVVVVDDEPGAPGEFALQAPEGTRISEAGGSITLQVTRSGGNSGAVTVSYVTAAGTGTSAAVPGIDYQPATGLLEFADGEVQQSFQVQVIDDSEERRASREFRVLLVQAGGGATIDPEAYDQRITVLEDDAVPADDCVGLCDCFIATAAYGSYLAPQVAALRQFRDQVLMKSAAGRRFVTWYYRVSPDIASTIADSAALRWLTRMLLTPLAYAVAYPAAALVLGALTLAAALAGLRSRRRRLARAA